MKKATKSRIGISEQKLIDDLLLEGGNANSIAKELNLTYHAVKNYIDKQKSFGSLELPVKIRMLLKQNESFGKLNDETQQYIVELYREGIPSKFIADLMGLNYSTKVIGKNNAGFYEKDKITFQDECRQAQAEATIKTIMVARAGQKPGEAIKFLEKSEATRDMYKAPKEEKGAIEIHFPAFSRDIIEPEIAEKEDEEEPKIIN